MYIAGSIPAAAYQPEIKTARVASIDLLRGLVMIIMALDHVRDYFHADAFIYDPLDLSKTNTLLFFTRWITHFCAPVFVFLAGTSAFLSGLRKTKKQLSIFLLTRGLWLIFLEITLINFAWMFNIYFPTIPLTVIWALGVGMVALSIFIHFPRPVILVIGIILVAGHNLLDGIQVPGSGKKAILWGLLHQPGIHNVSGENIFIGYPIIPWIGLMALGYCFGQLYAPGFDAQKRKRFLIYSGIAAIVLFCILRIPNIYGDAAHWSKQSTVFLSFLSFIKTSKYPPSLLYVLMTIGPALLFLAFTERASNRIAKAISVYGRVPFFYYLLHIYIIHLIAMFAAEVSGFDWRDMIITFWVNFDTQLRGYGFGLGLTYLIWVLLVAALYPLCRWYDQYKIRNKQKWWLSYL